MSKYKDADLILKLYDLRREKTMRDARNWFFTFNAKGKEDFIEVLTSDKSGLYRMVISYWDMACSLVNNGAIDSQMFNDANGEHILKRRSKSVPTTKRSWRPSETAWRN